MIYVVLGMHKSGTTLVSKILHESGIQMVESDGPLRSYREGGKYEWQAFQEINQELLDCAGRHSLRINYRRPLRITDSLRERARALIRECSARFDAWGFKDPRTSVSYEFWREVLPEHRIVVVYREPWEVWQHYRRQRVFTPLPRVLSHWGEYNGRILKYLGATDSRWIVLSFSELLRTDTEFDRLQHFLDRKLEDVRDSREYHNRGGRGNLFKLVSRGYEWVGGRSCESILSRLEGMRR
ncbi:MAG: sulfotransferase [Candidatus Hydrogenedentes bacterium]|nr:sulfotransferase [Candidatus Hydrogenedentota bacterium]